MTKNQKGKKQKCHLNEEQKELILERVTELQYKLKEYRRRADSAAATVMAYEDKIKKLSEGIED